MYERPLRPDELMHWQWEKQNHKYIDKIKTSSGWRYIYDEATGKNYERSKAKMTTARRNYYTAKNQTEASRRHMLGDFNQANASKNYEAYKANSEHAKTTKSTYRKANASYQVHNAIHKVSTIATKKPTVKHQNNGKKKFNSLMSRLKNLTPKRTLKVTHKTYLGR